MKRNSILTAAAALILVPAAWGQSGSTSAPPAAAANKVGVLNLRAAIVNTAEGKQASAELQSQFAPRQAELATLQKQIEEARTKLQSGTGTDEEKLRIQRQAQGWAKRYERLEAEVREDLQNAEGEIVDRIGRKMIEVLERHSRENGFSVVLDASSQASPLLFASNQVDLTQDLIRLYDQANPVRGAATGAAQPGQPRPGQPRPPAQKPPQQ